MTKKASQSDGLGTVPEVAEFLRLSRPTVYKLMNRGVIPSVKFGKARRIPWTGIREMIRKQTAGGVD
ncbi:MAG: helix-turn-helix domain-containing protein [Planctomycetota bacterium]|jgi:excisionase family DNA binding protein